MAKSKKPKATRIRALPVRVRPAAARDGGLYVLEVDLLDGPVAESFLRKNKRVARTIEIRGDQTLADLHGAIFEAYDRFDEHMYEFQVGGKGPHDPKSRRYVLPMAMDNDWGTPPAGAVNQTRIDALGLRKGAKFGYWFDFGDDWWHAITVKSILDQAAPRGKYPRITARTGESPPQYADFDEDEDEDEDGD